MHERGRPRQDAAARRSVDAPRPQQSFDRTYEGSPQPQGNPIVMHASAAFIPGVSAGSPRSTLVITGADLAIQPFPQLQTGPFQSAVFEPESKPLAQEGPLTYYPSYSTVDPQHKWQRIRDWASQDSVTALEPAAPATAQERAEPSFLSAGPAGPHGGGGNASAAIAAGSPNPLPSGAGGAGSDSSASIDSTLLEMELERARASLRVATAGAAGRLSAEGSVGRLFGGASTTFGAPPAPGPGPRPGLAASREPSFAGLGPVPSTGRVAPHPPGQHVTARADTFQAGLGAIGEMSALLNASLEGSVPAAGAGGTAAAGRTGAAGSVGISGYVHSMQHAHAAFSVERAALEARCRAAEEALSAAERRHAAALEPLQSRVSTLETSLAAERQLCGQLQEQLQVELQRLRTATEGETAARAAEAAAREMLAVSGQSLEVERRRVDEAAAKAAEASREVTSRIAALEEERSGLEKQLKQEKNHASGLHKQLREAQRQEQALLEKLGASEGARQQQEMRLEAAAEQVSAMRSELQLLNAKLAARDKQLLQHVKDVEETQLASLRTELAAAQSRAQSSEAAYSQLRSTLAAVHAAMGPQALAAAFGYSEQLMSGLSAGAAEYGGLADRLMAARVVAEEDGKAVVTRIKELVAMTRNLYMTAERREVALSTEMDSAMAALRQTNTDAEARLASCNTALRTTTQRVEELTNHLQESRARCSELDAAVQAARQALAVGQQSGEGLRATVLELQAEVSRLRVRVADTEGAERELSSSRGQVAQLQSLTAALQAQVEQLGGMAERSGQAVETKDERIRELRTALAAAMDGASKAEGHANALLRQKQEVADALEAERRRCADLESVVKASEHELERVRSEADAAEGAFAQLSQQVAEATRLAVAQAREMQQGSIGSGSSRDAPAHTSPMLLYATSEHLERACEDAAGQLTALEAYLAARGYQGAGWQQRPGTASSRSGPWQDSAGRAGTHGQAAPEALVVAGELDEAPKLCVRALLACMRQLHTQQALTHQQLITAQQHLRSVLPEGSGVHTPAAIARSMGRTLSTPTKSGTSGQQQQQQQQQQYDATQALPVHELAVAVATLADAARQAVTEATTASAKSDTRCEGLASSLKKLEEELTQAQQKATEAARLKEKLESAEAELQHVKAAAQAEFGRVQAEVSKAFQVAEQVREEIMAEADNRVRAVERAAAEATGRAEAQAAAAITALEARLREAEAARSEALSRADARVAAAEQAAAAQLASSASMMASLQEEMSKARSLLDTAEADLRALKADRAAGLQHVASLDAQLRRAAEEAVRWRKSAAPRIRDRMVMLAKLRVLRRKRADLVERLAAERQRGAKLSAAAEARQLKLKQGAAQLRQLQIDNVHLSSRLQEAESRAARADTLLPRMEDRRIALEQDRKSQSEKLAKLSGQLAEATKAAEAARKAEATARKELERVMREQLEPQQKRTATVLQELERAAAALQESQANATRLLQQGESLRAEVEELQHMLEHERDQAQEQLLVAARDVTERDAVIADMRQQLAVAQAAAAAAASLLPAVQSGQLSDATAVQVHLIGQLGQLQAANVELEARRAAVEAELEVLRVRIGRAEAGLARPATATGSHSMHTVYAAPQGGQAQVLALDNLAASVRSLAGVAAHHSGAAGRDDGTASVAGSYTRDAAGSDVIAAKDQRIHELRAALASVMSDRTVAQKEAAAARDEAVRAAAASAEAAARAAAEAEAQSKQIRELQAEVEQAAANVSALQAALQEREQRNTAALEDLQAQLRKAIELADAQRADELAAAHTEAQAQAEAREAWWRMEVEGMEARQREAASQAEAHVHSEVGAVETRARADADAREARWREEEARWREDARSAEARWRQDAEAHEVRAREALDAAERTAKQQLEDARAHAQQQIAALEQRLRAEASASEKRVRDAERAVAEAMTRADERTRQAERAREQLSQMQALHASAEEAVKQLTSQLRELQAGGSSAAQSAAAEAAALSATVDTLRREATLAKDTGDAHEQEVKRLQAQHEAAAALGRSLASQLQGLSEDLASARTRISVLQTEVATQQAELDTLRQTNATLKASLAAAEDRHLDSEAQLVEAEQSLSRQQGLVRQVQSENERLHEQYKELQQQLQKLTQERRSAMIASAAAAATTPLTAREGAASTAAGSPTRSRAAPTAATPGTAGRHGTASAARTPAASVAVSARGRQVAAALLAAAGSPGAESLGHAAAAAAGDLERQLLEVTVAEMQAKLEALQADLFAAEARSSQEEHNSQLLRMDLQAAVTRMRAAEGKVADLQVQLQATAAGTAEGVGALRQQVLDLELQLEAQRDREQAAQEAVARASARCEELQQQAATTERRVEALTHECEDRDLEIGVLRAQLASASAGRLAEGLQDQSRQTSHVQSALELQARQQAILVDSLQVELQSMLTRAEAAETALGETRSAMDALRAEAAGATRQREVAVTEAKAAAETLAKLRGDSSKYAERLSNLEAELLEAQAARDKAVGQVRAAEAQAEEERSEVRSLRRQLQAQAEAGNGSRSEAGGAAFSQRVADLESAMAAARQQARDAEDAVLEAAAAQVRASALETRTRELEVALTDAEIRLAAAVEAETRAGGSLVAQREAARQEVQELQLQLRAAADKLALSQQQVQDREARLEGYAGQVMSMGKQTEVLEAQLREVRQQLRVAMQERDNYRKQATASSLDLEYSEGARSARHNDDASSVEGGAPQLVGMLTENRDLLDKITTMHNKLKLARAKISQLEQTVRSRDAEAAARRAEAASASTGPGKLVSGSAHNSGPLIDAQRAELQAYKDALRSAQDEAAASAAVAAEAQARCDALTQRLAQERGQHTSRSQAGNHTEEALTPSTHQRIYSSRTGEDDGGSDGLLQKVRAQRAEIESLQTELQSANAKRTELARQAAALGQRVAESEMRERELSSEGEMLRQQLALAQQQLSSRQALLDQLTSQHKQQLGSRAAPGSPAGPSRSQDSGAAGFVATLSVSSGSQVASSQQQLVSAQQSAQQASKLDRVVAMWRDACRAKDARMQEMQADLTTFSAQLEKARAEVSSLTAQVVEREQALGAATRQLDLTRHSLEEQLLAAEEKLAVRSRKLSEAEDELQRRDQELHSLRTQLQATQRSLVALQDESDGHREAAYTSASQLAEAQQQVQHLQAELRQLHRDSSAAAQKAHETAGQVQPLQEQMSRAEAQVAQVAAMLRGALATSAAYNTEGHALATPGNLPTSLRLLEELVSVLVEELQRRTKTVSEAESAMAALQSQLAARQDDISRLEARLKTSQDGLAARLDELSRLQTALRRKEADCEAVEAEIAAQIGDYQRLKQRLLQQERDSSRLSADQESMLRRCDELEGALAAKQEECALLNKKCAQLEEQWQAGRAALAALQERVRSLDAQSEVLQRSNQTAALARQDAAASLDAARSELRSVAQQAATYREQLEQRNNEIRELNSMLQAWEAMRLGKDAQIAALLERCKRHEEDAAEKARTVEALRRKLQAFGAAPSGRPSMGAAAAAGSPNSSSYGTPLAPATHELQAPDTQRSVQSTQSRSAGVGGSNMGARHIHVHMHGIGAPAMSPAVSGTGSTMAAGYRG